MLAPRQALARLLLSPGVDSRAGQGAVLVQLSTVVRTAKNCPARTSNRRNHCTVSGQKPASSTFNSEAGKLYMDKRSS